MNKNPTISFRTFYSVYLLCFPKISNISFIKRDLKKVSFFVSNEYYTCLSFVHTKKKPMQGTGRREYYSNHSRK